MMIRRNSPILCALLVPLLCLFTCALLRADQPDQHQQVSPSPPPSPLPSEAEAPTVDLAAQKQLLRDQWGVEVIALRSTSHGRMLDFRYRVLDTQKAASLFTPQAKAYLVDKKTGKAVDVPAPAKIGSLRTLEPPKPGRVYWMFFGNPGKFIKPGDRVAVVIGEFRVDDLMVE